MNTFISVLGSLALILICAIILCFLIVAIIDGATGLYERLYWGRDDSIRREIGVRLVNEAYWYSESEDAMLAIESIGEALRDRGAYDISKARDKWHEKKTQPEQ